MTDQDRGAYTPPTDAPLSFDARQPVRGSRPAPFTLIASGFILILLVAAIVLFYRTGVRQAGQAPAAVGSPVGPLRAEAPADAQPADPAAGLQIYKGEEGATETAAAPPPKFIPPPEAPGPRPAPTAPVASAQLPPAAPAGLKPAPPIPSQPKVAVAPPPPKLPAKPVPAPAPAPKPTAPVAAAPAGTFAVQIGAFSSQALADKGYVDAGRITGVDIAGKVKKVEPVERNGATLYRTSVVGFASRAQAADFCAELKAAGKPCFVK